MVGRSAENVGPVGVSKGGSEWAWQCVCVCVCVGDPWHCECLTALQVLLLLPHWSLLLLPVPPWSLLLPLSAALPSTHLPPPRSPPQLSTHQAEQEARGLQLRQQREEARVLHAKLASLEAVNQHQSSQLESMTDLIDSLSMQLDTLSQRWGVQGEGAGRAV